jgi:hypothetical protein
LTVKTCQYERKETVAASFFLHEVNILILLLGEFYIKNLLKKMSKQSDTSEWTKSVVI